MERLLIEVRGTVQGIGFRPNVYSLATLHGLRGFAQNRGAHLFIDVEGDPGAIRTFLDTLTSSPPARAVVERLTTQSADPAFRTRFTIEDSESADDDVRVAPDIATCDECLAELFDPDSRRFGYPFITCAMCGPRFTIVTGVPYDRARTTMAGFTMCDACRQEFEDPADRRFHAQTLACPDCGPTASWHDRRGPNRTGLAAIEVAATALRSGHIVAVKGLGGYHLACDAGNDEAVNRLRERKHRDAKPFAVMAAEAHLPHLDLGEWQRIEPLLKGPGGPIVLLERDSLGTAIATAVAPGCATIGVMLPYSPLHHLLIRGVARPLVMTSGNLSDEPIAIDDEDARRRLSGIADAFLTHDRPIHQRCDDSVVRVMAGGVSPIRRARGLAPGSIAFAESTPEPILAMGGHQKNTFCVCSGSRAWLSHHIGDLSSARAFTALQDSLRQTTAFLGVHPSVVAHDLHPDYLSTRLAEEYPAARRIAVQHHHAHVLSCTAEHAIREPVLGVAFDGSGCGTDGAVWGGEFLLVDGPGFTRLAHLAYVPLAGGEAAIREPWRVATALMRAAAHEPMLAALEARIDSTRFRLVTQLLERRLTVVRTSSAGRLFDAIACLVGLGDVAAFEGQLAMSLEALAGRSAGRPYRLDVKTSTDPWTIDATGLASQVADDVLSAVDSSAIAAGFHDALATTIADVAARLATRSGVRLVALTGGVFQNTRLLESAAAELERRGLKPLIHRRVPCNDGGLSLGQALAAARILHAHASDPEGALCV